MKILRTIKNNWFLVIALITAVAMGFLVVYSVKMSMDANFYKETGLFDMFKGVEFDVVPVSPRIDTYQDWAYWNMNLVFDMPEKGEDRYSILLKVWKIDMQRIDEFGRASLKVIKNGEVKEIQEFRSWDPESRQKLNEIARKILTERFTLKKIEKYKDNLLEELVLRNKSGG